MNSETQSPSSPDDCNDALVIGGGPAGTAIATLLKEKVGGSRCFEQDHPRFHIGESLLPMDLPILQATGRTRNRPQYRYDQVCGRIYPRTLRSTLSALLFQQRLRPHPPLCVSGAPVEFDEILFRNCVSKGVDAHEGVRVDVTFRPGQTHLVAAVDDKGVARNWEARFIIDASGRDTVLARKLR